MPSAEIITVGTELLLGHVVDTNTSLIARALADIGIDVYRQTSVGDNQERIASAVREALARADVVLCAGGLGPTVDDLTRAAVACAVGQPLELCQDALQKLKQYFASLGRPLSDNNALQAYAPRGALLLDNPLGTAPGFISETGGRAVIVMPGVPRELAAMLRDQAIPWIVEKFTAAERLITRVFKTIGVPESEVDKRIDDLFRAGVNPSIAVLAHDGQVDVKVTAKAATVQEARALIGELEPELRARLGSCIYAVDGGGIEEVLGSKLRERGWSIATAESCTGGLIAAMLTSVAGSSDYFRGGAVTYSNTAKTELLGVSPATLQRHGAVSAQTAAQMAQGARARFSADIGLSVTGIAGPGGGTAEKPVGLVYVGFASSEKHALARRYQFAGSRELIRRRAALTALTWVWRWAGRGKRSA